MKVFSPEICRIALGQGLHHLEASSAARDKGECVSDVPGSKSMADHSMIHNGTWESHIAPNREASNKPQRRRRKYGGMAVGPGHIRGVDGVMPIESRELGHSKGLAAKCRGLSRVCHTLRWSTSRGQHCPPISTGSLKECYFSSAGTEPVAWTVYLHQSSAE